MFKLALVIMLLLGSSRTALAHRRTHLKLVLHTASSDNHGADAESQTTPPATIVPTFIQVHSARVENDLLLFSPTLLDVPPAPRTHHPDLFASAPEKRRPRFFAPSPIADDLEVRRERDRLLLFGGPRPQGAAVGIGLAMFGAATLLSAHAPRPFRILFDAPVHLGPAVFDGGGMGAGISARGL